MRDALTFAIVFTSYLGIIFSALVWRLINFTTGAYVLLGFGIVVAALCIISKMFL